jgi:putative addiction module killer protein
MARQPRHQRIQAGRGFLFCFLPPVGDGVYEMRIRSGAGYRLYYCQRGKFIYLLIGGGKNTKKGQTRDIEREKAIKKEAEEDDKW